MVCGEVDVVSAPTLPPFDAWTVVRGAPEPWGSHATLAAALRALDAPGGGAVTAGMTFLRWHPWTHGDARALLRAALAPHGFRLPTEGA